MVNARALDAPKAQFVDVEPCGFIYLGMAIAPPRLPVVRPRPAREAALRKLREVARQLEAVRDVVSVQLYRAVVIPPVPGGPRFDVIMLIRTTAPETIADVQTSAAYRRLDPAFTMCARNVRRMGDTDARPPATFLFNHFAADDADRTLRVWEHFTGWYASAIGADSATLLRPIDDGSPYAVVNYVRLPGGVPAFLLNQFSRPTFYRLVRRNLRINHIRAMPIFVQRL